MVKEFYSNMVGMKDKTVYVRGNGYPLAENKYIAHTIFRRKRMGRNSKDWWKHLTTRIL